MEFWRQPLLHFSPDGWLAESALVATLLCLQGGGCLTRPGGRKGAIEGSSHGSEPSPVCLISRRWISALICKAAVEWAAQGSMAAEAAQRMLGVAKLLDVDPPIEVHIESNLDQDAVPDMKS